MKTVLSNVLSAILIPLLAPTYLFCIIFGFFPAAVSPEIIRSQWLLIGGILISTSLPPFILVYILFRYRKISSLTLEKKEDRKYPQLFGCFNYVVIASLLVVLYGDKNVLGLVMIASSVSLIIITIITPFWKISTHAAGVWGMLSVCTLLYLRYPAAEFAWFLTGLQVATIGVCLARLHLKVHTTGQLFAGALLGIATSLIVEIALN